MSEHRVTCAQLQKLFHPESIAVVGASTRPGTVGNDIFRNLLYAEFNGSVYPVNPKSAQRYRDRKVPSGSKTDFLDAWSLADALRIDGHGWKALVPTDALTSQLQMLCRDEVHLIGQRTLFVNQLQQALVEYYPAALEAFDNWTCLLYTSDAADE